MSKNWGKIIIHTKASDLPCVNLIDQENQVLFLERSSIFFLPGNMWVHTIITSLSSVNVIFAGDFRRCSYMRGLFASVGLIIRTPKQDFSSKEIQCIRDREFKGGCNSVDQHQRQETTNTTWNLPQTCVCTGNPECPWLSCPTVFYLGLGSHGSSCWTGCRPPAAGPAALGHLTSQ